METQYYILQLVELVNQTKQCVLKATCLRNSAFVTTDQERPWTSTSVDEEAQEMVARAIHSYRANNFAPLKDEDKLAWLQDLRQQNIYLQVKTSCAKLKMIAQFMLPPGRQFDTVETIIFMDDQFMAEYRPLYTAVKNLFKHIWAMHLTLIDVSRALNHSQRRAFDDLPPDDDNEEENGEQAVEDVCDEECILSLDEMVNLLAGTVEQMVNVMREVSRKVHGQ